MRTLRRPVFTIAALMFLIVVPAMSAVYTIHLKNGNSFESRYKPRVAGWDENKIMVTTDVGNKITLHRDDVVDIVTDFETQGYGTVLDTTTIVLGFAPNDAPVPGDETVDPGVEMLRALQQRGARPNYSVEQFVEPSVQIPIDETQVVTGYVIAKVRELNALTTPTTPPLAFHAPAKNLSRH